MHRVPRSNNHLQAPRVRVQWVYLLLRYDVKNPFHISKFVSWRMRVICRKCYWEPSLERTKRTCLSLVYVTTRKQPSATNPFPPTERQNHCVTCPSGTRRDACTRETVRPDTDANWGEKKKRKTQRDSVPQLELHICHHLQRNYCAKKLHHVLSCIYTITLILRRNAGWITDGQRALSGQTNVLTGQKLHSRRSCWPVTQTLFLEQTANSSPVYLKILSLCKNTIMFTNRKLNRDQLHFFPKFLTG